MQSNVTIVTLYLWGLKAVMFILFSSIPCELILRESNKTRKLCGKILTKSGLLHIKCFYNPIIRLLDNTYKVIIITTSTMTLSSTRICFISISPALGSFSFWLCLYRHLPTQGHLHQRFNAVVHSHVINIVRDVHLRRLRQ